MIRYAIPAPHGEGSDLSAQPKVRHLKVAFWSQAERADPVRGPKVLGRTRNHWGNSDAILTKVGRGWRCCRGAGGSPSMAVSPQLNEQIRSVTEI